MRIGVVDLDTSHPQNWIPIERELGHEVVGVFDGGDVHPPGYAATFAAERDVPRVYDSVAEMVPDVDCAVIHSCDWDTHVEKARPFVEAGKSVLIDKPMAGKRRDLDIIRDWLAQGARIAGGSSLRYCVETREWLAKPVEERGTPHTVICGCGVDEFNYGIHAYAQLAGLIPGRALAMRHLGGRPQRHVQIVWPDLRTGYVFVGKVEGWLPFHATVVTERGVTQFTADSGKLYRALLEACLPYLAGDTDTPPIPLDELLEPERWAIAARASWTGRDDWVPVNDADPDDGFYGAEFAREYKLMRYPGTSG
ncbi:MAG: oxidoreductase [Armatimonadetes bacterium]|nr:oxidoreductase [Armatimonadota bacterium]